MSYPSPYVYVEVSNAIDRHVLNPRFFFLILLLPVFCLGQSNYYYPTFFTAYFFNMAQVSPAAMPWEGKAHFTAGSKSMTGAFRKVSSYYVTGSRMFVGTNNHRQLVRLQFYNEKEGSYISSPRGYANYAYGLPINEQLSLVAGASLGAAGVYYSAPTTTQQSYTLPDGAIGLSVQSQDLEVGASVLQVLDSRFQPFTTVTTLHKFYHLYAMGLHRWPNAWGIRGRGLYRHLPGSADDYLLSASVLYAERLELGTGLSRHTGLSFFGSFGFGGETDLLELMLLYNSTFLGNVPIWQNGLEIGLSYHLH